MPSAQVKLCETPTRDGLIMVPYRMERSSNLKHLRIVIDEKNQVILKAPKRVTDSKALDFLRQHGDWILEKTREHKPDISLWAYLNRQPFVYIHGRRRRIRFVFDRGHCGWLKGHDGEINFNFDPNLDRERQLRKILIELGKDVLPVRVSTFAELHRVRVHGVIVRDQRTRWGSCSETGGLSLNWRLILLPAKLQDHVILHELAHLKHFDHSHNFYRLLQRYDPNAEIHGQLLNEWSPRLMALGRLDIPRFG